MNMFYILIPYNILMDININIYLIINLNNNYLDNMDLIHIDYVMIHDIIYNHKYMFNMNMNLNMFNMEIHMLNIVEV